MGTVEQIGRAALSLASELGGMTLLTARLLRRVLPPRLDRDELLRALVSFGEASIPVILATAAFTGTIMVLQAAIYVQRFAVHGMVGWFAGFATFREVGPVLAALMFSGRVGANNTSELATMRVTEQLDALRVLALDVHEILLLPRLLSMILSLTALVILGDLVAVGSGAVAAKALLGIDYAAFFASLQGGVRLGDFGIGVAKAAVFGSVIGIISCHFGLRARGGSVGVGRAVNDQVVACAVAIFVADYLITGLGVM